jgi:hypothetical protein
MPTVPRWSISQTSTRSGSRPDALLHRRHAVLRRQSSRDSHAQAPRQREQTAIGSRAKTRMTRSISDSWKRPLQSRPSQIRCGLPKKCEAPASAGASRRQERYRVSAPTVVRLAWSARLETVCVSPRTDFHWTASPCSARSSPSRSISSLTRRPMKMSTTLRMISVTMAS